MSVHYHHEMRCGPILPTVLLASLVACGGGTATSSESAQPREPVLPRIDGRVVYDRPMGAAPNLVAALWSSFEEFRAARLPPQEDGELSTVQAWAEGPFLDFLHAHREALDRLETQARLVAASEDHVDRLFAELVLAAAYDSFRRLFDDVPIPTEIADDEYLLAIYREAMMQGAAPLARAAAEHYAQCARQAEASEPPLSEWSQECETRSATLREAAAAAPPPPQRSTAAQRAITWPAECADAERWPDEVEAPTPSTPLGEATVAVIYRGERVPESDVPRFLSALRERIGAQTGHRVLPAAEVERATALRADHRLLRRGPRCGQPPPLAWVLSSSHANLIIAEAITSCPAMPAEEVDNCRLAVRFRRPGTEDTTGLPGTLFAAVVPGGDPEAWIVGVRQLSDREVPLGGLVGVWNRPAPVQVRTIGAAQTDAWLRVPRLLSESNALFDDCAPRPETEASSLHVSWLVSATGETSEVVVRPRTNADEEVAACVQRALEGFTWPCTPANQSQRIELTLCLGRPEL